MIKAEHLYYTYEGATEPSLKDLSIEIKRGKKIAVMGANGSGKSTFFLCCNGILKPQKGILTYEGNPFRYTRKDLLALRSKVGIVFQDPDQQLFSASVYEEISFGILNLGVKEQQAKEKVEQVIAQLEITEFQEKPTYALSGGQKKQVSIADILVMDPELIIFDEPAASLDPKHEAMLNEIVDKLIEKGITVMMSTHNVDYALEFADEVLVFHQGRVLMQGTPVEVFSNRAVLEQANLKQPAVMQLFDRLCRKGVLKSSLETPKNLSTLEQYIEQTKEVTYFGGAENMQERKAILVVSFGTSHQDTREVTIDAIEADVAKAYPDYKLYRAWTSKIIMAKLLKRDGLKIMNVREAMEAMKEQGITQVYIQPTHVINGIENELMKEDALAYQDQFHSISFGNPLLTSDEDNQKVIEAIAEEFSDLGEDEALVLMGHGTTHYANAIYAALDYTFKDLGYSNIFLGTVEAYPSMETLMKLVKASGKRKVCLAPFMIVAGDHAKNDLSGEDPDSWYCQFVNAGYEVRCVLKGLGEYPAIRSLLIQHLAQSMEK